MEPRALVVEDDRALRETLAEILSFANYQVRVAENVAAAREVLSEGPVDIVLIDLDLGQPSGGTLLAELAGRSSAPACLLVSASIYARRVARIFRIGLVPKPFELEQLLTSVTNAIRDHIRPVIARASRPSDERFSFISGPAR